MKFLAIEVKTEGVKSGQLVPDSKVEEYQLWELYQRGDIRELYFRGERSELVLVLECTNSNEAQEMLSGLPRVVSGLIRFEIIPLSPYPGFSRFLVN